MPIEELIVDWACAPTAHAPAVSRPSAVTVNDGPRSRNFSFVITFLLYAAPHQRACPADCFGSAPEFPDERRSGRRRPDGFTLAKLPRKLRANADQHRTT